MPTAYDPDTLAFYQSEAPDYVASGADGVSRHLHGFLDRLSRRAEILELGCGGGRDAKAMIERGFRVDPTDGVRAMADKAAERIGRPVRVMRFDELDADAAYDAVWANASLLHVPFPALAGVLSAVHRALRPGGLAFASFKAGPALGRDRFGRYFNYPSKDELVGAFGVAARWARLELWGGEGGGYEGGRGPWIAVTATR